MNRRSRRTLAEMHREVHRTVMLSSLSGTAGLLLGLLAPPIAAVLELPQLLVSDLVAGQGSLVCAAAIAFFVGASTE